TSLEGIVQAINSDSKLGVNATLINTGDPTTPHRLLITANDTGTEAADSKLEVEGNAELHDFLSFDAATPEAGNFTETTARNAELLINDIAISSQSNTVKDAIEGVSLTLQSLTNDSNTTITITRDDSAATKAIKGFVDAYNTLQNT